MAAEEIKKIAEEAIENINKITSLINNRTLDRGEALCVGFQFKVGNRRCSSFIALLGAEAFCEGGGRVRLLIRLVIFRAVISTTTLRGLISSVT